MLSRHHAVAAGLALTLAFGAAQAPTVAYAATDAPAADEAAASAGAASGTTGDGTTDDYSPAQEGVAVPQDYDKAEFHQETAATAQIAAVQSARSMPAGASDEMKYFTLYESGQNYDQGFSKWDGYHAMGYYQFDRRYSLADLMKSCYNYDPVTFSMFKPIIDREAELRDANTVIFDKQAGRLTEFGQLVEDAWHAAYAAAPATFAALQDTYAINAYYKPTERWLANQGIDITGRADCVKGLVWGMSNLFGQGGVKKYLNAANLSNDMTDREFVNAIVDALPGALAKYNSNTKYHQSWINRYEKERATCLAYIAEDEAQAAADATPVPDPEPAPETPDTPEDPVAPDTDDSNTVDEPAADGVVDESSPDTPTDGATDDAPADDSADEPADGTVDEPVNDGATDNAGDAPANDGADAPAPEAPSEPSAPEQDAPAQDTTEPAGDTATDGNDGGNTADNNTANDTTDAEGDTTAGDETAGEDDTTQDGSDQDASKDDAASDTTGDTSNNGDTANRDENENKDENKDGDTAGDGSDTAKNTNDNTTGDGTGDGSNNTDGSGNGGDTNNNASSYGDDNAQGRQRSGGTGEGMPQTGDLVVMAGLASASLASFGGAAIAAGKRGLKRRANGEDDSASE